MSEPATNPDPAPRDRPAPADTTPDHCAGGYEPPPHLRRYLRRLS